MRFLPRLATTCAVASAALIGYHLGGWRTTTAAAARDEVKALLDTDRAFDEATAKLGVEGWVSYFADDGIMLPAGSNIVAGKEAIRKYVTPRFEAPGFSLRWEPIDARASGSLGYTYGISKASRAGADGKSVVSYGKYVTIWTRQRDGIWKIALDMGNNSPQPDPKR
jgi:uncharacterized protein (TIGR02246 family)